MTLEQYFNIYARARKTSEPHEAALMIFRALNREVTYGIEHKGKSPQVALSYANTIWRALASKHSEIKPDGFKVLEKFFAEKSDDVKTRQEILSILNDLP